MVKKQRNICTTTIAKTLVLNLKYLGNTDADSQSDVDSLSDGSSVNSPSDGGTSNGCIIISDSDDFEFPRNRTASDNTLHVRKEHNLQACSLDSVDRLLMESDADKTLTNSPPTTGILYINKGHEDIYIYEDNRQPIQNSTAFIVIFSFQQS